MSDLGSAVALGVSQILGFNPWLITGYAVFMTFGILYAANVPRQLSIPLSAVAGLIFMTEVSGAGVMSGTALLFLLLIGLGMGYLLFTKFR